MKWNLNLNEMSFLQQKSKQKSKQKSNQKSKQNARNYEE